MDASVASSAHGNIDEQISQLMECKPLSERDFPVFALPSISVCYFAAGSWLNWSSTMTLVSEPMILATEFSNQTKESMNQMKESTNRMREIWDQMWKDFSESNKLHQQHDRPSGTTITPKAMEEITPKAMEDMEEFNGDDDYGLNSVGRLNTSIFYGENPNCWLCEAEVCFSRNRCLSDREKVEAVVACFYGEAWEWFQRVDQRQSVHTWEDLKRLMRDQFSPSDKAAVDEAKIRGEMGLQQAQTLTSSLRLKESSNSTNPNPALTNLNSSPSLLRKSQRENYSVKQIPIVEEIPAKNHEDEAMMEEVGDQFERAATMEVEGENCGHQLENVAAKKETACLGKAIGLEFKGLGSSLGWILELNGPMVSYQIEVKSLGVGLVLEAAQQEINIFQQAQLHTNPIFFISPNDFSCPISSPSSLKMTIFSTSPNIFSGSILSSSNPKLNPISSFNTHQLQRTHSNSISLQLSPFLRPPRKAPDYVHHSNLEDKVLLRGVVCHG